MSSIAVFAVLGGAAVAAVTIPNNSVGTKQLKKNAVVSKKVKNGSLLNKDFKSGQLPAGATGPRGATGAQGDQGDPGVPGAAGQPGAPGAPGADGQDGAPGPATGPAGGGLAGNYPNPTIAAGAVGPSQWDTIPQAKASWLDTVLTTDQSAAHNVFITINWPDEPFDTASMHDQTANTSRLTAPVGGVYLVTAEVTWEANGDGARQIQFRKNGSTTEHWQIIGSNGGADYFTAQTTSTLVKLATGDYLELRGLQDSNTTLDVVSGNFAMTWVGKG